MYRTHGYPIDFDTRARARRRSRLRLLVARWFRI
jgi:hypothetical protein